MRRPSQILYGRKMLTIVMPRTTTKQLNTVMAALPLLENHLPLCWYSHRQGGIASADVNMYHNKRLLFWRTYS
jgi:hypothetical protein